MLFPNIENINEVLVYLEKGESGKVKIIYKGAFYRKYLNNDPPPEENDEAAIAAVTKMYKDTLKKFEKKLVSN